MQDEKKSRTPKFLFRLGLVLVGITTFILIVSSYGDNKTFIMLDIGTCFFSNFIIAIVYFFLVIFGAGRKHGNTKYKKYCLTCAAILFSISAYTLNNSFQIFSTFPLWFKIYSVLLHLAVLSFCFMKYLPGFLKNILAFVLGAGLILQIYLAIYLAPLYLLGIIGLLFFGLSIHLYVPAVMILTIVQINSKFTKTLSGKYYFRAGIVLPIVIVIYYFINWGVARSEINDKYDGQFFQYNKSLPVWVRLSSVLDDGFFTREVLKGDLQYDSFNELNDRDWMTASSSKEHNPLNVICLLFYSDINISNNTRAKILKSQFVPRHNTQRKLWSSDNLFTVNVINNTKIYPEYRFAYTEKTLTIKNFARNIGTVQEAAYTFYLPEGSVVTSLSLWINGKEEKSRLTSKSKADSAYRKLVGKENRKIIDPALLHWQEGNTVTVTVFPCTPQENRRFKIGVTTPLKYKDGILEFENIYFDGPPLVGAREFSTVEFAGAKMPDDIILPSGYVKDSDNSFVYKGSLLTDSQIKFKAPELSNKTFCFNGCRYHLENLNKNTVSKQFKNIYLDLNRAWDKDEFDEIVKLSKHYKLYYFNGGIKEINNDNKDDVFDEETEKCFSLFPFHRIDDSGNSLVITKCEGLSPNLDDLSETDFAEDLKNTLSGSGIVINLYNLGEDLTPYLKTLKERNVFAYASGKSEALKELLNNNSYVLYNDNPDEIELENAALRIIRDTLETESEAPGHLMRLFAYNSIMKELSWDFYSGGDDDFEELVLMANEAYVVSPVSSLVVLESLKDYNRFEIGENKNSLKNASHKSSGAVPEPGEWALIILFALIIVFLLVQKYRTQEAAV